eukprot:10885342-Alexandrium_andersonii.AAC.1
MLTIAPRSFGHAVFRGTAAEGQQGCPRARAALAAKGCLERQHRPALGKCVAEARGRLRAQSAARRLG